MSEFSSTLLYRDTDYAHGIQRLIGLAVDLFVSAMIFGSVIWVAKYLWQDPSRWSHPDPAKMQRWVQEDLGTVKYYGTFVVSILAIAAYQIFPRKFRYGTLGYVIARMRLISHDGRPPTWPVLMKRVGMMIFGLFLWGLGFIPAFLRKKRQTLHDMIAGTWMIKAGAKPLGAGQLIYKTKLLGTYPVHYPDIEPLKASAVEPDAADSSDSDDEDEPVAPASAPAAAEAPSDRPESRTA